MDSGNKILVFLKIKTKTNLGITSATALHDSMSSSCDMPLVLWPPAPWLAAMHWVAVAAACLEAFSSLLIILRLIVVPTAACVVLRRFSAAVFKVCWLSGSEGLEAHCLAASTILAVASASSLAAVRRRLCYQSRKGKKKVNLENFARNNGAFFVVWWSFHYRFIVKMSMLRRILMCLIIRWV